MLCDQLFTFQPWQHGRLGQDDKDIKRGEGESRGPQWWCFILVKGAPGRPRMRPSSSRSGSVEGLRSSGILTGLGKSIKGQEKMTKGRKNCSQEENGDVCETRLETRLFSLASIFTYMHGWVCSMWVPKEVWGRRRNPWRWSYKWLWAAWCEYLEKNLTPLEKAVSTLNHGAFFPVLSMCVQKKG